MTNDPHPQLEAWHPHEPSISEAQIEWLRKTIAPGSSLLDLGCGSGRTLVPLAAHGVQCTGLDLDQSALDACRADLLKSNTSAELMTADFRTWLAASTATWDVITCLGNTFCLIWKIEDALECLALIRSRLSPGGMFILDDIPADLWPQLTEGHWQEGLDPEAGCQLVWSGDDAVFTIRQHSSVDPDDWTIGDRDVPLRLWTAGALQLAAAASGFQVPVIPAGSSIRILRPRNG